MLARELRLMLRTSFALSWTTVADSCLACQNGYGTPPGVRFPTTALGHRVPPPVCVQRDPGSDYRAGVAS